MVKTLFVTAFLIHVGTRQLPRQMPTYIEKKYYHVGKKLQTWILYCTQILYFNPMVFRLKHLSLVENTVKHIHFWDHRQLKAASLFKYAVTYVSRVFLGRPVHTSNRCKRHHGWHRAEKYLKFVSLDTLKMHSLALSFLRFLCLFLKFCLFFHYEKLFFVDDF